MAAEAGAAAPDEYLVRAEALSPRIAAAVPEIERMRRIPAHLLTALHEAGLYRLLLPRWLSGGEIAPPTFIRLIERIAQADASVAWCLCQNNVCAIVAGSLPPASAREIFAPADAVLAWGPGPARALVTQGGYRLSGNWAFASGGRQATWLGAHVAVFEADGAPRRDEAGTPVIRTLIFPASAAPMTDIWRVMGLRGTASDAYEVTDLFVPDAFTLIRDDPAERREQGPLYAMTTGTLFAAGFAGVATGIARSLLDALIALAREKTPRGGRSKLAESALTQADIAIAEARLRCARMYLLGTVDEVWESIQRTNRLSLDDRIAIRLAASQVIHEAVAVADTAYHAAGASAIFEAGAFERRFRDIHAVAQQVQGRRAHFETVGKYLLGRDTDLQFV
ncbi:MAG: acyl-CoA dehydrogenase family protein [Stellaceae bacterium]